MKWLEYGINSINDMDWQWYPYLDLRPEKHEKMTTPFLLRMMTLHLPSMVLFSLITLVFLPPVSILGLAPPISMLLLSMAYFLGGYFLVMRLIFAPAWNSRAERLTKAKRRPDISRLSEHLVDTDALPFARSFTDPAESRISLISNRAQD